MLKTLKIIEKIFIGILIILIIFFGYYILSRLINRNSYSKMFGYYMFEVTSGSMYNESEPDSLDVGALVFVKPNKNNEYSVGMTITFKRDTDKNPITHKIIEIDGDMVTTKGINPANSPDEPFNKQFIIGEVKGVWQGYHKFVSFIKSPFGIVLMIVLGTGLFFGIDFYHKWIKKLEDKEKNLKQEEEQNKEDNQVQEQNKEQEEN